MTTRTSTRTRKAPVRFEDERFAPGANNKHTIGRVIDSGHSSEVEHDAVLVGDFQEVDREFVVEEEESVSEESVSEESDGVNEEDEWESEEEEEEELGYWETDVHPLPKDTYRYNVQDGIWRYCGYVKKIEGEYVVTLGDWLDKCPDNIYDEHEWSGNKVGKLRNVVIPKNRQYEYICGEFVFDKGWRNVQLPMGFLDNEDDE